VRGASASLRGSCHIILIAATAAVAGCALRSHSSSESSSANEAIIAGDASYHEREALPADALLEIYLIQVVTPDSIPLSTNLASTSIRVAGRRLPIPFALTYDSRIPDKKHQLEIRAVIRSGTRLLFETPIQRVLIDRGRSPHLDLILSRIDHETDMLTRAFTNAHWVLVEIDGAEVIGDARPTLNFLETGKASGSGACNQFSSRVEVRQDSIRFGAIDATRTACRTDISLQEMRYFQALDAATRFSLRGDTLSIFGSGGDKPLRFIQPIRIRY
jgi:putative lipoprotein